MQIERLKINMTCKGLLIAVVFTLTCSVFADNAHPKSDRSEFKKSLGTHCDDSYSLTCLKLDAVSWVDKLSENKDISVLPGVSFVKEKNSDKANKGDIVAELAREFPDDPNARLDGYLAKKVAGFFENHSVKLNLWRAVQSYQDSAGTARKGGGGGGGFGGGGGGKKGGGDGGMGIALAAGAMMKGMMMAMGLAAVAAMAGKALMASLAALLLAAVASLKGHGGGGGGGHSTYEVISKPIYTSSHSHSTSHEGGGGGGWDGYGHGRSLENAPLPLGLQPGYQPA